MEKMIHLYDVYYVDDVGLGKKNQRNFCQYCFFYNKYITYHYVKSPKVEKSASFQKN